MDKYEQLSYKTCVICGKPAEYLTKGWIVPVCRNCAEEKYKGWELAPIEGDDDEPEE